MKKEKKLTIGIVAHVDAGKTTLTEALLFNAGVIKKLGRVDHMDTFLDTDTQERQRGITIFSKQAQFILGNSEKEEAVRVMMLDTPGHVDFAAEMERTLSVLDLAVLVISAKDGVQGHAVTLWKLLKRYEIPAIIFINKMDLCQDNMDAKKNVIGELREKFGDGFFDMKDMKDNGKDLEEVAMCDERLLEEFLETGKLSEKSVHQAVESRSLFPCVFGSALKNEGVLELMNEIRNFGVEEGYSEDKGQDEPFTARVFKITRDARGERLTHLKILTGKCSVREEISTGEDTEKITQIRVYSGEKFVSSDSASAGEIVAISGLSGTHAGQLITSGNERKEREVVPSLEAVMTYDVILDEGVNVHEAFGKLKTLQEEDPQLQVTWNEAAGRIQVRLMGEVQKEILQQEIEKRFGISVGFGEGQISYKETIAKPVTGSGHYEPLRHYAEVHLLLEPIDGEEGIETASLCSEDDLDRNWQRLITTHLIEKKHVGALIGAPVSNMKISILAGRAHDKHTEGGDFRQATYRAIRQALRKSLMRGEVILLEPWYDFYLQVPHDMVGRAMADIQRMGGEFNEPEESSSQMILTGRAPVSEMANYVTEVASYTKGYGSLSCTFGGYAPCHDQQEVVQASDYDADRDVENPADSIFCSHGAGHNVPWNQVDEIMHIRIDEDDIISGSDGSEADEVSVVQSGRTSGSGPVSDDELLKIFEKTRSATRKESKSKPNTGPRKIDKDSYKTGDDPYSRKIDLSLPEYLLVDGYNILFAWDKLKELAKINIDSARETLIEILQNYQGYKNCRMIAVFDAYKVKGGERRVEQVGGLTVVYTRESETADSYIEKATYQLADKPVSQSKKRQKYRVRVATSDRLEQLIITGNDAQKVSAADFIAEIESVEQEIQELIQKHNRQNEIKMPRNRIEF